MGQLLQELRHQSQQQQRILQALCGSGAQSASADFGTEGGAAQSAIRRQPRAQPRDGDWACTACSFYPNFARRRRCLQCGREKAGAPAARGGTLTAGPVGASGLRPQLAWGAARLGTGGASPTHRVPGSSAAAPPARQPVAARSATIPSVSSSSINAPAARGGSGAGGNGGGGTGGAHPASRAAAPRVDEDGFTVVARNAGRRRWADEEGGGDHDIRDDDMGVDKTTSVQHAGPGVDGSFGEMGPSAADGSSRLVPNEDEDEDEYQHRQDDPSELRNKLENEQSMVRALIREGVESSHPAMLAAVAARDAAEEAWRAARRPHPVARRMGWAQQALDRAVRSRDKVRDELANFDERTKQQRSLIEERLGQAMERVSKRREALEELQEEAALDAPGYKRGLGTAEVCSQLAGGMRQSIAPQVAAIASMLADGSQEQEQFNLLVAQLEGLQGKLDLHAHEGNRGHEEFDIADEPSEAEWSESHDLPQADAHGGGTDGTSQGGRAGLPTWTSKGHGRWNKDGEHHATRTGKGTGHVDAPPTAAAPAAMDTDESCDQVDATTAGAARSKPGAGSCSRGRGGRGDESAPPPNKLHKGQATSTSSGARGSAGDDDRAQELMQAQQGAAAAGDFGSPAAIHAAAQIHSRNVDKITKAAIEQGVQPITDDGDELIVLGPQELAQWASDHLDSAKGQWW